MHEKQYSNRPVRLSRHAWQRYCERVKQIDYDVLRRAVSAEAALPHRHNRNLCKLAGVWWRYADNDGRITLITCYGWLPYDLIDAQHWCLRHNDRVRIT